MLPSPSVVEEPSDTQSGGPESSPEVESGVPVTSTVAGFWRRLLAFVIDTLLLGFVGAVCASFAFDFFARVGHWGRGVGFLASLLYFGVMNSAWGGGQTPGKRLAKIRVVGALGGLLSPARTTLRASVLSAAFFLNGAPIDVGTNWAGTLALAVVVFGFGASVLYLAVFNRRTRQSLHDLVVGSFVVPADATFHADKRIWPLHYAVVGAIFVAVVAGTIPLRDRLSREPAIAGLTSTQQALMRDPIVRSALLQDNTRSDWNSSGGTTRTTQILCRVDLAGNDIDDAAVADHLARTILDTFPSADTRDAIVLTLSYGFDIGIASRWRHRTYAHSPSDWRARLANSAP